MYSGQGKKEDFQIKNYNQVRKRLFHQHQSWNQMSKYCNIALLYLFPTTTPISFVVVKNTVVK